MFESKRFDFYLFIPALLIIIFSFGMVSSVSPENLVSQFIYLLISLIFFLFFYFIDTGILISFSPIIYIFCVLFLILPFIFGSITRGSVRWIPIGGYTIQPSEIVKPFLCVVSAWFWKKRKYSFLEMVKYLAVFGPILLLIFIQPDLGSTLVILSIFGGVIFYSGIRPKQIITILLIVFTLLPFFWLAMKDYQKTRFLHFLNPQTDPLGQGYNQIQAKITVGSGKLYGWGLGRGSQSHLSFLPERHTDFIFSSMAEEFGFIGSVLLVILYLLLFLRIIYIAGNCSDRQDVILAMGIFWSLFFQTVVNIGMNIGIFPITGVTLPLFSYGGSSLLSTMIGLGMLENIFVKNKINKIISIRHF